MLFNFKNKKLFLSKETSINIKNILSVNFDNFINNKIYIVKYKELELISENNELNSNYYYEGDLKFPEEALKFQLRKGNYLLSINSYSIPENILLENIKSSKGDLIFDENRIF